MKYEKIHFINRLDRTNAGDWTCCPLEYYYDYFKDYSIIRHDIDYIDYNAISENDIVILGGSGMLDVTESFNEAINKVLNLTPNVIGWSLGFNTHDKQWYNGKEFQKINFEKFRKLAIRDFNHPTGIEYLPDPSCRGIIRYRDEDYDIKREYGIIEHKDLPIRTDIPYERINHNASLEKIVKFILESECIITNSYHCTYWCILLKRKVIVFNKFSSKFDYFKYKPEFVKISEECTSDFVLGKIKEAKVSAKAYSEALQEAVKLNDIFFESVKKIINELDIPRDRDYQTFYELNRSHLWNREQQIEDVYHRIQSLQDEICEFIKTSRKDISALREECRKIKEESETQKRELQAENEKVRSEYEEIKSSESYKIGLVITWGPRKMYRLFKTFLSDREKG